MSSYRIVVIEILTLISLLVSLVLAWHFNLNFHLPDITGLQFIFDHYLSVLVPGLLLVALFSFSSQKQHLSFSRLIRLFFAFTIILIIHFNYKLWSSLINPTRYDIFYLAIDQYFISFINFMDFLYSQSLIIFRYFTHPYHDIFVGLFLVAFTATAFHPGSFEKLLFLCALILIIGGLSYTIAPAWGPFLYMHNLHADSSESQTIMLRFYSEYSRTHGQSYEEQFFIAPLAAMPSLHLGHSVALTIFTVRQIPWLGVIFIPLTIWIAIAAIALRWHYLIDLPAGIFLGLLVIFITDRIYDDEDEE